MGRDCRGKLWGEIVGENCGERLWGEIVGRDCGERLWGEIVGRENVKNIQKNKRNLLGGGGDSKLRRGNFSP